MMQRRYRPRTRKARLCSLAAVQCFRPSWVLSRETSAESMDVKRDKGPIPTKFTSGLEKMIVEESGLISSQSLEMTGTTDEVKTSCRTLDWLAVRSLHCTMGETQR